MNNADESKEPASMAPPVRSISAELNSNLNSIAELLQTVAYRHQGDGVALLALLRVLEAAHREIRDSLFQESLPQNRQQLYTLLKDIEAEGGWPYIPRMKLQTLIAALNSSLQNEPESDANLSDPNPIDADLTK